MSSGLRLSVVIPTLGRPAALSGTLTCLQGQECEGWECIVVSQDAESRRAAEVHPLAEHLPLTIEALSVKSASVSRNRGLKRARGDVVLFLDDDVRIDDPAFLEHHLANYRDPKTPGVVGQIMAPVQRVRERRHPRSRKPRVGWLYFPYNYAFRALIEGGPTGNLSVRRRHALAVGGMDEQFERGAHREDSDFCLRLTAQFGPLVFDPRASLVHLGATEGGCRSWGVNRGVHPMHHVVGEWYFILKNLQERRIQVRDAPDHLFCLVRRQILNAENRRSPRALLQSTVRSARGFLEAIRKVRHGPVYPPWTAASRAEGTPAWSGDLAARGHS